MNASRSEQRPLRVLALGPVPPPFHGVATYLRDLLSSPPAGIEFTHLDTSDHRDANNLGRWDVENVRLGLTHCATLAQRCLRSDCEIVYLPLSQSSGGFLRDALFIFTARLFGKKVVAHLHGGYFRIFYEHECGPLRRWIARRALRRLHTAIVLGEEFRAIFDGLLPAERVCVVENGVPDPGAWELTQRSAPPGPTILFMSTLTRTKGIAELLRAFALLRQKIPAARLRVAGKWADDELRVECERFVAEQQLNESVEFSGNVDGRAKAEFLASGTVFCLPSRYPYEGQPLVLLEALAAGLPVVSTRHAAIPSLLGTELNCGELVPSDVTPEALCGAIERTLQDPVRLQTMRRNARERYLQHFTMAACQVRLAKALQIRE